MRHLVLCVGCAALAIGCERQLMPTPNLYAKAGHNGALTDVPEHLRSNTFDVLYATDRAPDRNKQGQTRYGYKRSNSLAFGVCKVEIGNGLDWEELIDQSTTKRTKRLTIQTSLVDEKVRFPAIPMALSLTKDGYIDDQPSAELARQARESIRGMLSERLARSKRKDIFLYVHGYNNNFDDATLVIAQLWHFMGRPGVPMAYTWPAGLGGLRGYLHDRESGEFTIYHLKQLLRTIASVPELNEIHIIAHSRGTDVICTALRELKIEFDAAGSDPRATLKLGNVVMAASDMDLQVVQQRLIAERVHLIPRRMTVYISRKDMAIALAEWLFGSITRLGLLQFDDLTPFQRRAVGILPDLQFIDAQVSTDLIGHAYFHSNPAVSSDLILMLKDDLDPGAERGRPLIQKRANFWILNDRYPVFDD